jgi:mycothiol synthase
VRSDFRRKGIALGLKVRGIAFAQQHGYETIITRGNPANAPITALNTRLGFVQQPAVIHFRRAWTRDMLT